VNFRAEEGPERLRAKLRKRSWMRGSRALDREDLGLSGSVWQEQMMNCSRGDSVFIYLQLQLMAKMWDIRRREMHIQL
jgi:hypothetical protein